jgi:predicted AAA+ superfamily ATPase
MIERTLEEPILKALTESKKVIILFGARQVGKTTLSNKLLSGIDGRHLIINGDEIKYTELLSSRDFLKMKLLLDGYDLLFIDEAQRIPEIGINLKIIIDNMPELKILVTGSSSFDLANQTKEPLTGRSSTFRLNPFSLEELRTTTNLFELQQSLEAFMIYGLYPDIVKYNNAADKEKYLLELTSSYLYKDVLELSSIRNSAKIHQLLRLIAFQIGSEVSLNEIAGSIGMNQETVAHYIDLLEKSFVLFRLGGFSRNLRKEISKRDKIYFWDLGVRNSLIQNFAPLSLRTDTGALWENFIIAERLKYLRNNGITAASFFWRTYTGGEIDYIEERNGQLHAFEIKFSKARKKAPQSWIDNYGSNFSYITRENFWEFTMESL